MDHSNLSPKLKLKVFYISAAVDDVDPNATSTTSKSAFHGTEISLIQHLTYIGGIDQSTYLAELLQ